MGRAAREVLRIKIYGEKDDWLKVGYYLENEVVGWIGQDLVGGTKGSGGGLGAAFSRCRRSVYPLN
jgi:hypothetical protein